MRRRAVLGRTMAESTAAFEPFPRPPDGAPHVVLILLDDLGFAQLGCFGSDVETPAIDGVAADALIPADGGEVLDENMWRVEGDVELPDLAEGHDLDILARALLPEGGESQQEVVVKVADPLGREYLGEFVSVSQTLLPGVTTRITATVTFVREQGSSDTKIRFVPTKGEFHWEYGGTSGTCTYRADPVTLEIKAGDGGDKFMRERREQRTDRRAEQPDQHIEESGGH